MVSFDTPGSLSKRPGSPLPSTRHGLANGVPILGLRSSSSVMTFGTCFAIAGPTYTLCSLASLPGTCCRSPAALPAPNLALGMRGVFLASRAPHLAISLFFIFSLLLSGNCDLTCWSMSLSRTPAPCCLSITMQYCPFWASIPPKRPCWTRCTSASSRACATSFPHSLFLLSPTLGPHGRLRGKQDGNPQLGLPAALRSSALATSLRPPTAHPLSRRRTSIPRLICSSAGTWPLSP